MSTEQPPTVSRVDQLYQEWFLDYASHVVLSRAVPSVEDGLKPVQRLILHAMYLLEDGRYNKVANIVGQTMQFHPHGDASITDALVQLGQKELLIDKQGNWGDLRTGDRAAAARYIEARLSQFALASLYNPKITAWQPSYDNRKEQPIHLPVKYPILLYQGTEGIAVGLSTKILPHNFNELIDAAISFLQGRPYDILPDFPTGGLADISDYREGRKGGRVRIRAKIEVISPLLLHITELPYGQTTGTLIDSILKANQKGSIRIKKVVDNTASSVQIKLFLEEDQQAEQVCQALFLFTNCEVTVSPNACVIKKQKPYFSSVKELLSLHVLRTKSLLQQELLLQQEELKEKIFSYKLRSFFIEKKIYSYIASATQWESLLALVKEKLKPFETDLYRPIKLKDIEQLTEIKIKQISRYDRNKQQQLYHQYASQLGEVNQKLKELTAYTIAHYKNLKKRFGQKKSRKTKLLRFENLGERHHILPSDQKVYVDREEGFIGSSLTTKEWVANVTKEDKLVIFLKNGGMGLYNLSAKKFVGKMISYVGLFDRQQKRHTYNMIYLDGGSGKTYAKRFQLGGLILNKKYWLITENPQSKILYCSSNPNGEAEKVALLLSQNCAARKLSFTFDFSVLAIKNRKAKGNIITRYPVKKIEKIAEGVSTLPPLSLFYASSIGWLNDRKEGVGLGSYAATDHIYMASKKGRLTVQKAIPTLQLNPTETLCVGRFELDKPLIVVYWHGSRKQIFIKKIKLSSYKKDYQLIPEMSHHQLLLVRFGEGTIHLAKSSFDPIETLSLRATSSLKTLGLSFKDQKVKSVKEISLKWHQLS